MKDNTRGNPLALLPLLIFVALFIGTGIITRDFQAMPITVALIVAIVAAMLIKPKDRLNEKIGIVTRGAGRENIMLMVLIFLLAGAFSQVAENMGAVESTVNLGLSLLPSNLLLIGLFIICCFISISMGTSTGTVVALAPIAIGIAGQTDLSLALALATVIGGAMFGDNLSVISDTTIVSTQSQEVKMSDKFKTNFFIVLPGAIATIVILWFISSGQSTTPATDLDYNLFKVLPYLAVLIIALLGVNVLIVLSGGIVFAGLVGFLDGSYTFTSFVTAAGEGIGNMQNISIIAILIGGLIALIQHYGGIDYLLHFITSRIRSRRGAEFGIASLVSATDLSTANNTISIIITGPLAKDIADEYGVDRRKSASILDIFAAAFQGLIPYGGQMLAAAGLAAISPVAMIPYSIYPAMLLICGIIAILIGFPRKLNA
ncbi:Na+/H+ antiporter NhaC family protein [Salinicoccus roseus]|uniref:Na+/H+ antiporter NhaC family protein n=1 Tax=Salinicoccus roseus TaxID=45670 RepID=A0A0C2DKR8_9STAP|nr:Na+/H+ antiporter NhaC family protein [Salinicoccus roseus]KIH70633.1 sodium:proton antiporter [Salinicoccus roseus]MDB0580736.1 Na+/H+ antiporter NhaC family protein [Salinicoccus roseus]